MILESNASQYEVRIEYNYLENDFDTSHDETFRNYIHMFEYT